MSNKSLLKDLKVTEPCSEEWGKMTGNNQVRFCSHCDLNVNNVSEMTRGQVLGLLEKTNGRLCVRYVQHPKTKAPVFAEKIFQITRQTGIAAGFLGTALAANSLTYAQGGIRSTDSFRDNSSVSAAKDTKNLNDKNITGTGSISGVVADPTGALIPGTPVILEGEGFKRATISNDEGKYNFTNLPKGIYSLTFNAQYFKKLVVEKIELLTESSAKTIDASLEVSEVFTQLSGVVAIAINIENPLVQAVYDGEISKVRLFISRGFDVNSKEKGYYLRTALHVGINENNLEIVKLLLNAGADVNALDENGNTPLMLLDEETSEEIVKLLVRYGTNLNIQSKESKRTVLLNAALNENLKAIKALAESGADVNLRDSDGESTLDLVTDEKTKHLLIAYGAKPKNK